MTRRYALAVLLAASMVAACATLPGSHDDEAATRGRAYARQACGQCHGLDREPSPWASAPPFGAMRFDFNGILYERRVAELSRRHVSMPPVDVSEGDLQDLAAYVASLKRQNRKGRGA